MKGLLHCECCGKLSTASSCYGEIEGVTFCNSCISEYNQGNPYIIKEITESIRLIRENPEHNTVETLKTILSFK